MLRVRACLCLAVKAAQAQAQIALTVNTTMKDSIVYLVDELHVARHARDRGLTGGGLPQEHGEVVGPRHQALWPPGRRNLITLLRCLPSNRKQSVEKLTTALFQSMW